MRLYEQLVCNVLQMHVRPTVRPLPWQRKPAAGAPSARSGSIRRRRCCRGCRSPSTATACCKNITRCRSGSCSWPSRGWTGPSIRCATGELDIIILLDRADPLLANGFNADQMLLFCTPAINLFPRRSDRINLARGKPSTSGGARPHAPAGFRGVRRARRWRVTPATAARRRNSCRSTRPTTSAGTRTTAATTCCAASRGSFRRAAASAARGSSYLGHEVFISLVDADQAPVSRGCASSGSTCCAPTAICRCRCRWAGSRPTSPSWSARPWRPSAASWARWRRARAGRRRLCVALHLPSRPQLPEPGGHRRAAGGGRAAGVAAALRPVQPVHRGPAAGGRAVGRVPAGGAPHPRQRPLAAGRGLGITLTMDEAPFGGSGAVLLAGVLERFFAKYVSINGFTETVLRCTDRGEVMRWPLRLGRRPGAVGMPTLDLHAAAAAPHACTVRLQPRDARVGGAACRTAPASGEASGHRRIVVRLAQEASVEFALGHAGRPGIAGEGGAGGPADRAISSDCSAPTGRCRCT